MAQPGELKTQQILCGDAREKGMPSVNYKCISNFCKVQLFIVLLLAAQSASATLIIGNLTTTGRDAGLSFIGSNSSAQNVSHAAGFKTPEGLFYKLDNIRVRLGGVNGFAALDATDDPLIRLFSGAVAPTTELATFTKPIAGLGRRNYRVTSTTNVILNPSTVYWIVLQNLNYPSDALFGWMGRSDEYTGSAQYFGATVGVDTFPTSPVTRNLGFEVNGTSVMGTVSSPSTLTLLLLGLTGFRWLRRNIRGSNYYRCARPRKQT